MQKKPPSSINKGALNHRSAVNSKDKGPKPLLAIGEGHKEKLKKFIASKGHTRAVAIVGPKNVEGTHSFFIQELAPGEKSINAYSHLMRELEKRGITISDVKHNVFLDYYPESQVVHHEGRPAFPDASHLPDVHANAMGKIFKAHGFSGKYNILPAPKTKK